MSQFFLEILFSPQTQLQELLMTGTNLLEWGGSTIILKTLSSILLQNFQFQIICHKCNCHHWPNARFAFTTELRDTGHYGFELPANQIIPSGEVCNCKTILYPICCNIVIGNPNPTLLQEMWAGFEVVIDRVQQTIAEEKTKKNLWRAFAKKNTFLFDKIVVFVSKHILHQSIKTGLNMKLIVELGLINTAFKKIFFSWVCHWFEACWCI